MKAAVSSREQTIVDRQLIIETIRDVSYAESESSSVSLGVSVNWAGQFAPSVSVSASDSMQNSELVHFISGISGADVKVVAETIKLKGAEIFGTEKLNIEGKVTTEDVEVTRESSSSHMGFSFDPIKGQGLTSINFGIGEKHDNGVVHSGVGTQASHEQTDKGGYTLSLLGNNVLVRGFKEAYNWLTEPKPVANDLTSPEINKYFETQAESDELKSEFAEARKNGLSEEEALYAVKAMNNLKDEPSETNSGIKRINLNDFDKIDKLGSEATTIASEYYGGWDKIPEAVHQQIGKGYMAYVENGELKFDSAEAVKLKVPHHEQLVKLAYKADKVIRVAGELAEKYGTATDIALTALNALVAGVVAAGRGIIQSAVAEELVGEYIKEGAVYVLEKGAAGVQKADPYISKEHAKKLVLAFGGVIGAALIGKEVKDIWRNVHAPKHKLSDAPEIKHKHDDIGSKTENKAHDLGDQKDHNVKLHDLPNSEIEWDKQGKHIRGHKNFIDGRSELTHSDPQGLINKFAGKGQPANDIDRGMPGFKERFDAGEFIGYYADTNGNIMPTTKGMIIYSKNGVHLYPSKP